MIKLLCDTLFHSCWTPCIREDNFFQEEKIISCYIKSKKPDTTQRDISLKPIHQYSNIKFPIVKLFYKFLPTVQDIHTDIKIAIADIEKHTFNSNIKSVPPPTSKKLL